MATRCALIVAAAVSLAQVDACADIVIDFETTPAGLTPNDNQQLIPTYVDPAFGVTTSFGIDTDGDDVIDFNALFEQAGEQGSGDTHGFLNNSLGVHDVADAGLEGQLGDFFLRGTGLADVMEGAAFIIDYGGPRSGGVVAASGEIWDIDASSPSETEQFVVTAYGFDGSVLGVDTSPEFTDSGPTSLDGEPWVFNLSTGVNAPIDRLEITFTGSRTSGLGLAINNLSLTTASVPEPSSLILTGLLSGVFLGGGAYRRRFSRRRSPSEQAV